MRIYPKDTTMTADGIEIDLVRFGNRFEIANDSACKEDNLDKDNPDRDIIDVAKINNALKRYWECLGIE